MKKLLVLLAVVSTVTVLAVPAFLAMVTVLFSAAAAAQGPCVSPIGAVLPTSGPVRLPVAGSFTVMSEFGMRFNPGPYGHGQYRLHGGIDLAETPRPGPVVAVKAGVVKATPTEPTGGGNIVVLDHGGGLSTEYKHLATRAVTVGDTVWAGRQLGTEGSTGNSTGPHLHFEVHLNGQPTNPRDWFARQGVAVPALGASGTAPGVVAFPAGAVTGEQAVIGPVALEPHDTPPATRPVAGTLPSQVGPYRGVQVTNAAAVIKAGQAMNLDTRTITTGVMTAMGESSLKNVPHGDAVRADTIGLFQIGPEHGSVANRMDPTWAATNFYKRLTAVPGYQLLEPTVAAHKAQRNADPYHYAPYWADAVLMVSTLTQDPELLARLPAAGQVAGCEDGGPTAPTSATGSGSGAAVVAAATHYLGTPYSWGGGTVTGPSTGIYTSPSLDGTRTVGFDCSGLVLFAVNHATGIQLPHSAESQGRDPRGRTVPRDWAQMQPGDVIAFSEDGSGAPGTFGHVGIYLGNGKMVHAPRPGKSVEVTTLRGVRYWESMAWRIERFTS